MDQVIGIDRRLLRSIGLVVPGLCQQTGIESGAACQVFFLRLGAVDEAATGLARRCEIEQDQIGDTLIKHQPLRRDLGRLVGDVDGECGVRLGGYTIQQRAGLFGGIQPGTFDRLRQRRLQADPLTCGRQEIARTQNRQGLFSNGFQGHSDLRRIE